MSSIRTVATLKIVSSSLLSSFRSKGLFNDSVKTMAFSMAIMLVNMGTGMITARWLGPEGRGMLTAMILLPQFLAFVTTFGIHTALLFQVKKTPEEEGALYYSSLFLTGITGMAAISAGIVLIPLVMGSQTTGVIPAAQLFMSVTPFMHLFFVNNALFCAREEFHLFNRLRYLVPVTTLIVLLSLAVSGVLSPFTTGLAYLLPYIPIASWAVYRRLRLYRPRPRLRQLRLPGKRIIRYGLGSYGIDLLGNLILYIDQIILIGLLAPGPLGLYVVAVSLSRMINVFSGPIIMVLFPKVSGLEEDKAALLALRVFKFSTCFALLGASVIVLAAPLVIGLLYGGKFLGSIPVFRLLLLDVVLGGSALVLGQAFMAAGKPIVVSISQGIGLILIIPLMYILVPVYGITGAGWALLFSSFTRLIFIVIKFQRKFDYGIRAIFFNREDMNWFKSIMHERKKQREGSVEA